jgi:flagellar basal-body rod protein FlgC
MSLFDVFQLTSQGMTAQRQRLEAASANLANAHTTRTAEGGPYRRRDVVFEEAALERGADSFGASAAATFKGPQSDELKGVRPTTVVAEAGAGVRSYQPEHPDAGPDGYVTLPDVDPLEETVNMLSAARSFEANATAFQTAKEMVRASLRLGEG